MSGTDRLTIARGFNFDTLNVISCVADRQVLEEAFELCVTFEKLLSRFVEGSDVWRINHAQGEPVEVSLHTSAVIRLAEEVRVASGGAFNVAVGEASTLWNFSSATPAIPAQTDLEEAARRLAGARLVVDGSQVTAYDGIQIDLGGIAKGYICDRIADFLRERGVQSGLLNFGGNVVTIGDHPEGRPWSVALQKPNAQRETIGFAIVKCSNSAVVTSGPYERGFELGGKRYHHILDPRTCWPVESGLLSVSILAADAALADALATAVLVLGAKDGFELVERYGVNLVLLDDADGIQHSKDAPLQLLDAATTMNVAVPLKL